MNYTTTLGTTNEIECLLGFLKLGYTCSTPYGNSARYDFIVDINNKLIRVQCKCSQPIGPIEDPEGFLIETYSTNSRKNTKRKYLIDEIDYFATSFAGNIYIIPISECLGTSKVLRLKPPKNNVSKEFYNPAENYELCKLFPCSQEFSESKTSFKSTVRTKQAHLCPICGKEVTKKGNHCIDCTNKLKRKVDWPDKEILEKLIETKSMIAIGKMYGVSDNTVRKWCKHYNISLKKGSDKED